MDQVLKKLLDGFIPLSSIALVEIGMGVVGRSSIGFATYIQIGRHKIWLVAPADGDEYYLYDDKELKTIHDLFDAIQEVMKNEIKAYYKRLATRGEE